MDNYSYKYKKYKNKYIQHKIGGMIPSDKNLLDKLLTLTRKLDEFPTTPI